MRIPLFLYPLESIALNGIDVIMLVSYCELPEMSETCRAFCRGSLTWLVYVFYRLGPLGLVEVAVQGSWESLRNGQAGLVSFDTFLIRPKEILGTHFGDDLPSVSLALPQALKSTAEWEVLYLDETLRINRGQQGELFIFTRKI